MVKRLTLFLVLVLFSSCTRHPYKKTFVISGTYLTVTSPDKRASGIVYDEFKRLNKIFNIYDKNSEVSRLNNTYNRPFGVSDEMIELISLSKELYRITGGYFDVSKGRDYSFWKDVIAGKEKIKTVSSSEVSDLTKEGGMEYIKVDRKDKTVIISKRGLLLDFSAIAKGYMVDKAAMRLRKAGVKSALINAGGDIYCLGKDSGKPWKIGIKEPSAKGGIIDTVFLSDEAAATSGDYEQFIDYKGRRYSHIINPKTGYPVNNGVVSVTVVTKNCTSADGLATAFFAMGPDNIKDFLSKVPYTMKIFVVVKTGGKEKIYVF